MRRIGAGVPGWANDRWQEFKTPAGAVTPGSHDDVFGRLPAVNGNDRGAASVGGPRPAGRLSRHRGPSSGFSEQLPGRPAWRDPHAFERKQCVLCEHVVVVVVVHDVGTVNVGDRGHEQVDRLHAV